MADGARVERRFEAPTGSFDLLRHPVRARSSLRAWDAADAYALRWLDDIELSGPVALINDGFGALTLALHKMQPIAICDSALSAIGIDVNRERNGITGPPVQSDGDGLMDGLAAAIIKVPKSLGLLEEQLHMLRPKLQADAVILGAGMVRQIHTSTLQLFESILGKTTTSLAEQKSRLIHCELNPLLDPPNNPWPKTWKHAGLTMVSRGGVFSAESVDIGTRLLLEHLPSVLRHEPEAKPRVMDLGCGNGILGVAIARSEPKVDVAFVDSSAVAIDSATRSWVANHGERPAEFHRTDRLVNVVERASVDLVINNPPFHDERAVSDATAWDMFVDSHTALRLGGELRVVANQQLGHHARLKKIFGNCETIASNRKFVVLSAVR